MVFWFLRGVRRGVVTTHYPDRPEPSTSDLPTPPRFRSDLLTADLADRLVAACPGPALYRDEAGLVLDLGACTGCGRCERAAADVPGLVTRSGEFELATSDRNRLLKHIPIGERQ